MGLLYATPMATLDLTTQQIPLTKAQASVGTTLREILPPRGTQKVSIRATGDVWLQIGPGGGFSDGGSVDSASAVPLDKDFWYDFSLVIDEAPTNPPTPVYVAAAASTVTVYMIFEGAE